MMCTVAEPQRKLPVFKPGNWSLPPDSRVSLYGHDAFSMKNITLHFDMAEQCDSLDRSWFGEVWFSVAEYAYQVHSSVSYDSVPDPADLDLEHGYREPELCLSKSQVRDPAYALLDSGATHVLQVLMKFEPSRQLKVRTTPGNQESFATKIPRMRPLLPLKQSLLSTLRVLVQDDIIEADKVKKGDYETPLSLRTSSNQFASYRRMSKLDCASRQTRHSTGNKPSSKFDHT